MSLQEIQDAPKNGFISRYSQYLEEFVYGGIDGSITTFAVVAGSTGASLDNAIIIILGFANLLADGFSMSVGAYLSANSKMDTFRKHQRREYWEIENLRESEVEEIREIYRNKGFEGELLEEVVAVITSNKEVWVDTMMKEELEMVKDEKSPFYIGLATYISFIVVGLVPLITYLVNYWVDLGSGSLFLLTCMLTSLTFIGIGFMKAYVNETSRIRGVLETLLLGGIAAVVAYYVGDLLENIF